MSTQTTRYVVRALGLALIAGLVVCAPETHDRHECRNWAALQAGSDTDSEGDLRARTACLEGRGYSVK